MGFLWFSLGMLVGVVVISLAINYDDKAQKRRCKHIDETGGCSECEGEEIDN